MTDIVSNTSKQNDHVDNVYTTMYTNILLNVLMSNEK